LSPKFIAIYNANGGIFGEVKYFLAKLFRNKHCELCDITHVFAWKKKSWKEFEKLLGLQLEVIHLNNQNSKMEEITLDKTPCILLYKNNSYEILITSKELALCNSNVSNLIELFNAKERGNFV
tara:strand:- start:308 stop:676 length:369 start_codon:yes stop_codon:yes gene_type:complete